MQGKLHQTEENKWYVTRMEGNNWETFYPLLPECLITQRCIPGKIVEFEFIRYCPVHKSSPDKNNVCTFDCAFEETKYVKLIPPDKTKNMKGTLQKIEDKWEIINPQNNKAYQIHPQHIFWLKLFGKTGAQMNFIREENFAILKSEGPDNHEYTQD